MVSHKGNSKGTKTDKTMKNISKAIKEIQSRLIEGERVVISRTGIDIDLMDGDEAPDTLLQTEDFVQWISLIDKEKRELAEKS
mgnify:CR=1 FL=1